jgi:DNA mismatch repair protein MutH
MMMTILRPTSPPNSEGELLARAHNMVGTSLGHLFQSLGQVIPENSFANNGLVELLALACC